MMFDSAKTGKPKKCRTILIAGWSGPVDLNLAIYRTLGSWPPISIVAVADRGGLSGQTAAHQHTRIGAGDLDFVQRNEHYRS